ncbi:YheC/YheD family endospore coat-associated protein [Paenibacillus abyssi]|uniref:YheC/YheD family protein n=1 Tax=Paenibacillus abyssi TaxID=1340531 RepID=A0A917CUM0_9BACL|nr:YheC/YheD family protein [Paenibacillus abyssi]GGF98798.1 hypothetical protein GCM10010916_15090 [Paenibacillus abyssi]
MESQYVGILVNSSVYRGIPSGKTRHEAIRYYEEAGRLHGLIPCYFRLQDIHFHRNTVHAYVKHPIGYIRKQLVIPHVIHNRALFENTSAKRQIERLIQSGKQVFNSWNRYRKLYIHELLMEDTLLRPHLPGTVAASPDTVKEMMAIYDSLILKPDNSSIGRGLMKMDRLETGWQLTYCGKRGWRKLDFKNSLPLFLQRKLRKERYIVQQRLPLATYNGSPFDLRVSVQRSHDGNWQVTGIAAKVAAKDLFITNVAQGGSVYRIEDVLQQYPELNIAQVRSDITSFCLRTVHHLSGYLPHLADAGFDIGITANGFPMFVECNGRDLRYSFQLGNLFEEWKATYANPIGYARFLFDSRHK